MDRRAWWATVHRVVESDTAELQNDSKTAGERVMSPGFLFSSA